jgi:hypothetical protein
MRLSPQQLEHLKQHLQSKFKNPCHICGSGNWQFDDTIFEVRQFMGGGVSTEGLIKPVVAVTCGDCGNVALINAFASGVLRVQPAAQQAPQQQEPAAPTHETSSASTPPKSEKKTKPDSKK